MGPQSRPACRPAARPDGAADQPLGTLWEDRQAQRPFTDYASFLLRQSRVSRRDDAARPRRTAPAGGVCRSRHAARASSRTKSRHQLCQGALCAGTDGPGPRRGPRWALRSMARRRNEPDRRSFALSPISAAHFTQADQDRADGCPAVAARRRSRRAPASAHLAGKRELFAARLAILQGGDGRDQCPGAMSDPGYLYNRSRELRQEGQTRRGRAQYRGRAAACLPPVRPDRLGDRTARRRPRRRHARFGAHGRSARSRLSRPDTTSPPANTVCATITPR